MQLWAREAMGWFQTVVWSLLVCVVVTVTFMTSSSHYNQSQRWSLRFLNFCLGANKRQGIYLFSEILL